METYEIMLPGKVYFGVGSQDIVGDEAARLGAKRALIVTDPGVYQAGLTARVKDRLSEADVSVDIFSDVEPEPTLIRLDAVAGELSKQKYDLLVAVGGGSSIDTAKALSIIFVHGGKGHDYIGINKVPGPGIPLITMPTTSGTGSEVTKAAVFGDTETQSKFGIQSPYIYAQVAITDPSLTYGCPPKITATTGIDALSHAIEAYTSRKASTFTDVLQMKAIKLISGSLREAVKDGSNKKARQDMSEGSLFGGFGIAHAGGAAAHALCYPLGSRFHNPHGMLVGTLLPYVMEVNIPTNPTKYAKIAELMGVGITGMSLEEAAKHSVEAVRAIAADIGIPQHVREIGVPKEALESLTEASMKVTRLLDNNPRKLTLNDIKQIWENAW
jgi:alcohol dehydrogenase class IV